jgi:hypothetical protein
MMVVDIRQQQSYALAMSTVNEHQILVRHDDEILTLAAITFTLGLWRVLSLQGWGVVG